MIELYQKVDAHLNNVSVFVLILTPSLIAPMEKVREAAINQLFLVYSKVLPKMKYMALRVNKTTSIFEYLN